MRACGAYRRVSRTRSSMIFNHNRSSKGLDFGFAEKGKKLAPLTPTRIAYSRTSRRQSRVRVYAYICVRTSTRSILVPQAKEKNATVDTCCDSTYAMRHRVRRNGASRDVVMAPAAVYLIES